MSLWRSLSAFLAIFALLLLAAGCSNGDDGADKASPGANDSNATGSPEVTTPAGACSQAEALQQSAHDLAGLDILAVRINGVVAAVDEVRADAQALRKMVSDATAPQVDAFLVTVSDSRKTISGISNRQLSEEIKDVEAAINRVSTAASDLQTKIEAKEC